MLCFRFIGKEVALFAEWKFEECLVNTSEYKEGQYAEALRSAFHKIDEMLELPVSIEFKESRDL